MLVSDYSSAFTAIAKIIANSNKRKRCTLNLLVPTFSTSLCVWAHEEPKKVANN